MLSAKSRSCLHKDMAPALIRIPSTHFNQSKIVSLTPSLESRNNPSPFPPPSPPTTWLYNNKKLEKIIKTALNPSHLMPIVPAVALKLSKVQEKPLKAIVPDIYYAKSYKKRYNFYQQCEDHFITIYTINQNRVFFATIILKIGL